MKRLLLLPLFALYACFITAQTAPAYGTNAEKGAFRKINGVNLYYEIYGTGEPLLLIHGNSTGIKGWAKQIEYFSKKYQVIAVDCRGRGQSELGKDSLTYLQQAHDMYALIRELKIDSVTVVGKSDGGVVALFLAIHHPEVLKQIVAYASNASPDSTAMFAETVQSIHDSRVEAEKMLASGDQSKNWLLEQQKYRLMEFQPHITAEELAKITVPVLVMSCDRDVVHEEHTLWIYRNIPFASLSISPGEVHRFPTLNPELFNAIVDNWISQPFKGNAIRFR